LAEVPTVPFHRRIRLTLRELLLLIVVVPVVVLTRIALAVLPSRVIVRLVRSLGAQAPGPRPTSTVASSILWAVQAVSRRIPRASCLTQALSAQFLLRCFGQHAQLCLGVARTADGSLRAHAWLEQQGRPVLGGEGIHSLVRLPELPTGKQLLA
jgi:hypothetical protein